MANSCSGLRCCSPPPPPLPPILLCRLLRKMPRSPLGVAAPSRPVSLLRPTVLHLKRPKQRQPVPQTCLFLIWGGRFPITPLVKPIYGRGASGPFVDRGCAGPLTFPPGRRCSNSMVSTSATHRPLPSAVGASPLTLHSASPLRQSRKTTSSLLILGASRRSARAARRVKTLAKTWFEQDSSPIAASL